MSTPPSPGTPDAGAAPVPAPPPTPPPAPSIGRSIACMAASLLMWVTQGLGMNLVSVNLPQLQGVFGATLNETNWLMAAYMAPNVSLSLILVKVRQQYGLRLFAELSLLVFVFASLLHLFVHDLRSALMVRFLAGMAASPISSLGFLYMLDAFPPAKKMNWGLSLALTCSALGAPVARLISPALLDIGEWQALYALELGLALMALAVAYLLPLTPIQHAKVQIGRAHV